MCIDLLERGCTRLSRKIVLILYAIASHIEFLTFTDGRTLVDLADSFANIFVDLRYVRYH